MNCGMDGEKIYKMHRRNTGRCGIFFDCNSKGERKMIHFVGAGSGAVDLITVRGQKLLEEADIVVYAGSLVNPELLKNCQKDCQIYNSAKMTLEEVMEVMISGEKQEKKVVRLHTGDPVSVWCDQRADGSAGKGEYFL